MSRTFRRNRHRPVRDFRGLVVACLLVTLAPSLMAEAADGQRAATNGEQATPEINLLVAARDREHVAPTGFEMVELRSESVTATELAVLNQAFELSARSNDDKTLLSQDAATTAPPAKEKPPTLQDLGFPADQDRGSAEAQARLDKRSHMLKIHQRLGLIALVPLLGTIIASGGASGKHSSRTGRDVHGALGLLTAGLYSASAYYAIAAPKIPGTEVRGPIRVHKILAWIHGAGMILTPILGAMADAQRNRGQRVHGVAAAHSAVADVTIVAYGAAAGALAIKF